MDRMGQHLSLTEVNSQEAERESVKIKLLEFFERDLQKAKPTVFAAIVTEVRAHGLFIELEESLTFGFLAANALGPDFFNPSNDGTELVGRKTKRRFRLNDRIHLAVDKVDRVKRMIDFKLVDESGQAAGSTREMSTNPSSKKRTGRTTGIGGVPLPRAKKSKGKNAGPKRRSRR
jgi:ribonuclease R